jgi:hypothetical protein
LGDLREAVEETLIVKVEVGLVGVTEVGFSVQVIPVGAEQVRATVGLNPVWGVSVMVDVADEPLLTGFGLGEDVLRVKQFVTVPILAKNASEIPPAFAVWKAVPVVTGKSVDAVDPTT